MEESSKIILIGGGARSGKSRLALSMAQKEEGPKIYLATGVSTDSEMEERIQIHKNERDPKIWQTIEEPLNLENIKTQRDSIILLDCLTFWVNNLTYHKKELNQSILTSTIKNLNFKKLFVVTNEVGMGLVPMGRESRDYRDLLGLANQWMAELADEVYYTFSGLPLKLK